MEAVEKLPDRIGLNPAREAGLLKASGLAHIGRKKGCASAPHPEP